MEQVIIELWPHRTEHRTPWMRHRNRTTKSRILARRDPANVVAANCNETTHIVVMVVIGQR